MKNVVKTLNEDESNGFTRTHSQSTNKLKKMREKWPGEGDFYDWAIGKQEKSTFYTNTNLSRKIRRLGPTRRIPYTDAEKEKVMEYQDRVESYKAQKEEGEEGEDYKGSFAEMKRQNPLLFAGREVADLYSFYEAQKKKQQQQQQQQQQSVDSDDDPVDFGEFGEFDGTWDGADM